MATARTVYRLGSATDDALTPRVKDIETLPGQKPGLSVEVVGPGPGQKAQKVDVTVLAENGLAFFVDDPSSGGREGHGVISPVDASGKVDQALLKEWASYRGTGKRHRFTQAVLDAIIERDVRS
ncbi:MAG: hypothetical protein ABSB33_14090 [Tepidisphaeraceae bacterium]|jgi:hypothetical protein